MHQDFINSSELHNLTLLSDTDGKVTEIYDAEHWLLPVASRVYILVDKNRRIFFRENKGFSLLEIQTETLLAAIDSHIR